jgi:hypothetical protein
MHASQAAGGGLLLISFFTSASALAAPAVWIIDDGEKIKQDAQSLPFASGASNPVWAPGKAAQLVALRNETVSLQVVISADAAAASGVTVDLDGLAGPGGALIRNDAGATDPTSYVGRPIERFVEHYFDIQRASGGKDPSASLGWASGSGPSPAWTGLVPDALIPVEVAPTWDPYPMNVAASQNAAVWIDITVPATQAPGTYTGSIVVKSGASTLATIPLELEVAGATLPDTPVKTMLFYDPSELSRRIGTGASEERLWQLYHRHRLSAMHGAITTGDAQSALAALDGTEFTSAHGYAGPGEGKGDGILSLGTYGGYGAPNANALAQVTGVADLLGQHGLFPTTDVFIYAIDESCNSSYGPDWKSLLAGSTDPNVAGVKVGWTCSDNPASQQVDVPIVGAWSYDPTLAAQAAAAGKKVWIYNGQRPESDAFFTDTPATAPRANGWIAAMAGIDRWFYWETTFWYDDNHGGHGAYDPFTTAETFHNSSGDYCEGDGVLVYPGKQVDVFTDHSVGLDGVIASIRLKNLRRGIEDAGYYQLAHTADAAKAEAIATALLPTVLSAASDGSPVSWPASGQPWFLARKALLALIPQQAPVVATESAETEAGVTVGLDAGAGVDSGARVDSGAGADSGGSANEGAAKGADAGTAASGDAESARSQDAATAPASGSGCSIGTSTDEGAEGAILALGLLAPAFLLRQRRRSARAR